MPFQLTILGSGSATPTLLRNPSAQALVYRNNTFLLDCGEGTQLQCLRFGIKIPRVNKIFISHLHADHCLGLLGILSTLSLIGREDELSIFGPPGIMEMIDLQSRLARSHIPFPINFFELKEDGIRTIYEDPYLNIKSLPVEHRLPCWGFLFKEKHPLRKVDKARAAEKHVPVKAFKELVAGKDYVAPDGKIYSADEFTHQPYENSYAYITDTIYLESLAHQINGTDVIYHEATFMDDLRQKAIENGHSTSRQAANFALEANAKKLIIGHFSARYKDVSDLLKEAKELFQDTLLAEEGKVFEF